MSKLKLKRDTTTTNAPHPDQLEIGELVMNTLTGKLYMKSSSGRVLEFSGRQVCYEKTPIITFDSVANFCCFGDLLNIKVSDLKSEPQEYIFEIEDLTNNDVGFSINSPIYTTYEVYPEPTGTGLDEDLGPPINMREAVVPVNLSIAGTKPITMLKFKVVTENTEVAERTITISCKTC